MEGAVLMTTPAARAATSCGEPPRSAQHPETTRPREDSGARTVPRKENG